MTIWKTSALSAADLNRAGRVLVDQNATPSQREAAVAIVGAWRSSHAFPLNTIQMWLRGHARKVSSRAVVAQRIKRLESVENKLRRFPTMKLSQIQDFGGCRAILPTLQHVESLVDRLRRSSSLHELKNEKNYIDAPAPSGYRSRHLIYRYNSVQASIYCRHFIEIQVRTQAQHDWATAVEIFGTFLQQELKSGRGEDRYLRFFRSVGELFYADEAGELKKNPELYRERAIGVHTDTKNLKILQRMEAFRTTVSWTSLKKRKDKGMMFLMFIDLASDSPQIQAWRYQRANLREAIIHYTEIERRISSGHAGNIVLVSTEKFNQLRKAYPNYFLDSTRFARRLQNICEQYGA